MIPALLVKGGLSNRITPDIYADIKARAAGLAVAVTRTTHDGTPAGGWLPDERLPLLQAISDLESPRLAFGREDDVVGLDGASCSHMSATGSAATKPSMGRAATSTINAPMMSTWTRNQNALRLGRVRGPHNA